MKHIDKLYHFIVGMFIFWVANLFMNYRFKRNYICIWDIMATTVGGLFVWLIILIDLVVM